MKIGLSLMKYVFAPLTKSVLIPLKLTAVASAADTGIHKISWEWDLWFRNNNTNNIKQRNIRLWLIDIKALLKQLKMKRENKEEDFLVCY